VSELPLEAPSMCAQVTVEDPSVQARPSSDQPGDAPRRRSEPTATQHGGFAPGYEQTPATDLNALPALLTVAETAEILRVGRSWVYEHAAELGAVKLGSGQTAPLRIPSESVRRMVGLSPPRRERRSVPATRNHESAGAAAQLCARPRL
jgi:hypothetical protein